MKYYIYLLYKDKKWLSLKKGKNIKREKKAHGKKKYLTEYKEHGIIHFVMWHVPHNAWCGGCGEAVNTADCGSVMRGFDPHHSPHFFYDKCININPLWGYSQAVRQRTLTPLSVVRLHLPLPEFGHDSQEPCFFCAWKYMSCRHGFWNRNEFCFPFPVSVHT